MSKLVVISGDDFGISEAFSIGALRAWKNGIVSALALMVNLPTTEYALELRRHSASTAPLSLHFNIVLGDPVSDPASIPSLVDGDGHFYRSSMWRGDDPTDEKCHGTVYPSQCDVEREALAQIERYRDLVGSYPSHIDCHSVVVDPVSRALCRISHALGIHCEGSPAVPGSTITCAECMPMGGNSERVVITSRGSTPEDWQRDAFGIESCPFDVAVVHVHPGYIDQRLLDSTSMVYARCRDYETMTDSSVKKALDVRGIEMVSYEALYPGGFKEPSTQLVRRLVQEAGTV